MARFAGNQPANRPPNISMRREDKAAQKGVIHKNNAARHKSRLMHKLADAKKSA